MFKKFQALVAFALFTQTALVYGQSPVILSCIKRNTVAITFDDGPWIYMKEIVDTLEKNCAKATFFVNGNNWGCIYNNELASNVQYAYKHGHQIASHTWSHPDLATLTEERINEEFQKLDDSLEKIIGVRPKFLRPPYGSYNTLTQQVADKRRIRLVNWDLDSGDSMGATVNETKAIYDKAVAPHPRNINALNHETRESSAKEVLPYIIDLFKRNRYEMVTIAECLGDRPYLSVRRPSPRNETTWQC